MASLEETSTCDWHDALVELAEADSSFFAGKPAPEVVHETIAEEESRLREIETKLARQYGTPRLGNKIRPG